MISPRELLTLLGENKIAIAATGAIAGAIVTKYIPAFGKMLKSVALYAAGRFSRTASAHSFRTQYLDWVVTEHRELKLAGVVTSDDAKKPTLEQVFVSLNVARRPGDNASDAPGPLASARAFQVVSTWKDLADILAMHRDADLGGHPLYLQWLTDCRAMRRRKFPGSLDLADTDRIQLTQWLTNNGDKLDDDILGVFQLRKIFQENTRIAILGVPGAGKTTLLQYLALTYAREKAGDPKLKTPGILTQRLGAHTWRLPVFLRLSSVALQLSALALSNHTPTIVDVITALLPADLRSNPVAHDFFLTELHRGRCLILLDGLDEVPSDSDFAAVIEAIKSLLVAYRDNQFVVTSRIVGWRGGVNSDFEVFYVNNLSDHQVTVFVNTWYSAVEQNAVVGPLEAEGRSLARAREQRAAQRAAELRATLHDNAGLRRLAVNPMLLSIIALVHRSLATLPKDRAKLYAQCGRILLEQWDVVRGVHKDDTHLKVEQKESIMRRLAFALHTGEIGAKGGGREASYDEFRAMLRDWLPELGQSADDAGHLLDTLMARSGIVVERQRGILAFAHHTFQEYFAAQYLAMGDATQRRDYLLDPQRLWSDWWREVILLYAGTIDDASDLVQRIYAADRGDLAQEHLRLAVLCMSESIKMSDTVLRRTLQTELFALRQAEQPRASVILRPDAVDYLTSWAKSEDWKPSAAIARVRKMTMEGSAPTAIVEQVAQALRGSDTTAKRAALRALKYVDNDGLWSLAEESWPSFGLNDTSTTNEMTVELFKRRPSLRYLDALLLAPEILSERVLEALAVLRNETHVDINIWRRLLPLLPRVSATAAEATLDVIRNAYHSQPADREDIGALLVDMITGRDVVAVVGIVVAAHVDSDLFGRIAGSLRWIGALLSPMSDHLRTLAARTIVGHDTLREMVMLVLGNAQEYYTAAVLDCLADSGGPLTSGDAEIVLRSATTASTLVRPSAARVLTCLAHTTSGGDALTVLRKLSVDRVLATRVNAIASLRGFLGEVAAEAILLDACSSRDIGVRAAAVYVIDTVGNEELRFRIHQVNERRSAHKRARSVEEQWYEFVELAFSASSMMEYASDDEIDGLFEWLWLTAMDYIARSTTAERARMEQAAEIELMAVADYDERLRGTTRAIIWRYARWRRRGPRLAGVTTVFTSPPRNALLEISTTTVHDRLLSVLASLMRRSESQRPLKMIAADCFSADAPVREFALKILKKRIWRSDDSGVLLPSLKASLDDRATYMRFAGIATAGELASQLGSAAGLELIGRLADEDSAVRDATWATLAREFPNAIVTPGL